MQNWSQFVSRETLSKLKTYEELLIKWQKSINLVSRGTLNDVWQRHIEDSLQLIPIINSAIKNDVKDVKILDVGSGGGFPGMVLSIVGYNVACLDSDQRKTIFLSEVARLTQTDAKIICDRIEKIQTTDFDIVTARGFSSLNSLLEIVLKNTSNGIGIFLKGKSVIEEIKQAKEVFSFDYDMVDSITDESGKIVVVKNACRKTM